MKPMATATLSMWMSNIAAAAMMIAALHPLFADMPKDDSFRRALLVGIALGANFGGIATPIGTGPNAIAIASIVTPPNAMVYSEGGVKSADLLVPGLTLMFLGCLLLSLTGPFV